MTNAALPRRGFLRGLTGAMAGAAVVAPSLARAAPLPDPHVLQLEHELQSVETRFLTAAERRNAARARLEAIYPTVPEEIVVTWHDRDRGFYGDEDRDVDGNFRTIGPNGERHRRIHMSSELERSLSRFDLRTRYGRLQKRRLPIARAYEAAIKKARSESGFDAAYAGQYDAERALEAVCKRILDAEVVSLPMVILKAKALLAFAKTAEGTKGRTWMPMCYGNKLAAEIVAISAA